MADSKSKTLVAMSGGVDSSVAAALLREQGDDLVGVTLHLWDAQGEQKVGRCCAPEDRDDARRVCDALGIPHYVIDERTAFREDVVAPFVSAYVEGQTPSPCVACNQHVKLTRLVELADTLGATHIATGHYARLESQRGAPPRLMRGLDQRKDQSYFLFGVPAAVLSRMVFPLGGLTKDQVRSEGRRLGVPNADKPESQELCFVPDGRIAEFIDREVATQKGGVFRDEAGNELGTHRGVHHFTVGQRKGIGLPSAEPRYVLRIIKDTQDVIVGPASSLFGRRVSARGVIWTRTRPDTTFRASVRIRYGHEPAVATITPTFDGFDADFDEPQRAIAPGQAAVVYDEDEVVAGGYIQS